MILIFMQPGAVEGQVGAQRLITISERSYVEQLEALDDERYIQCAQSPHPET